MATDVQSTLRELGWLTDDAGFSPAGWDGLGYLLEVLRKHQGGWPEPVYVAVMNLVVRSGVELVIIRDNNGKREVLLTWRDDRHFRGWHLPGSRIDPRETYQQAATRCALGEIGCDVQFLVPLYPFNQSRTGRAHDHTVLILCVLKGEPTTGAWFSEEPPDLLDVHRKYWPEIELVLQVAEQ